jgi:hypothetical protein
LVVVVIDGLVVSDDILPLFYVSQWSKIALLNASFILPLSYISLIVLSHVEALGHELL